MDNKLQTIKESLEERFNDKGYKSIFNDEEDWFILTKETGNSFQSNGFIVEKKENQYTCKLKWWAGEKETKARWAGEDTEKLNKLNENILEKGIDSLISVCEKKWNGVEKPKGGNGLRGMNVKIAEIPIKLAENKESLTSEFIDPIFSWEKTNIEEFDYIQNEIKKGTSDSEIENIKQRLIKEIQIKEYLELLINNHNIILHGAPGTGKTYLAKQIAKDLIFTKEEHDLIDKKESDIAEADKPKYKELKEQFNKRCGFVQFHQSYDYTDFVEGLRPVKNGTDIGFELRPGVFKEFCKEALEEMNESVTVSIAGEPREIKMPFVFIIDEINRGEMSKIFGELFYSIDPGYRVKNEDLENGKIPFAIQTQYSNLQEKPNKFDEKLKIENKEENKGKYGHFFVAENVYIIGTMNDIDRSVESMDFAMRRRFAFEEISADDQIDMLEELVDKQLIADVKEKMKALNDAIEKIDGLSAAYHIGPAYFLKLKNYKGDFDLLWEYHIEGVVMEYLRGMDNAEKSLIELKKAYFGAKSVDENHNNKI